MSFQSFKQFKSQKENDILEEPAVEMSDLDCLSDQEELIPKELVALLNSSHMELSGKAESSIKSGSSLKMAQSEDFVSGSKDCSFDSNLAKLLVLDDERRMSYNPDILKTLKHRSSLFNPSKKEDYFTTSEGVPGWVCSQCKNFNYESIFLSRSEEV